MKLLPPEILVSLMIYVPYQVSLELGDSTSQFAQESPVLYLLNQHNFHPHSFSQFGCFKVVTL